jgi:putative endopeptidase
MAFQIADEASPYLSARFVNASFEFRGKTLSGQPENRPRWKRAVGTIDRTLGEAVGKLYIDAYFPAQSKTMMLGLVGDLRTAMKARIERLAWMSPETKTKALEKLSTFTVKIAYPDKWRDYSALTIASDDLVGNIARSAAFRWNRDLTRLNGPVDRSEWGMTPQTVNAYYNPQMNEIVFPAAILQSPFFDPEADPAINYGGIGGVIGHEITHGFDDQGRQFAADGSLNDWWQAADATKFKVQTDRLDGQYSAFEPLPGAKVQGQLTMGENIADLGGLLMALDAYKLSLKGQPSPIIDGITGEQRVFLGWAQVWRAKSRDDALRQQIASDPHSPPFYRVNGVVRNIDAWYEAFGVKPGDALYVAPENRVRIW